VRSTNIPASTRRSSARVEAEPAPELAAFAPIVSQLLESLPRREQPFNRSGHSNGEIAHKRRPNEALLHHPEAVVITSSSYGPFNSRTISSRFDMSIKHHSPHAHIDEDKFGIEKL